MLTASRGNGFRKFAAPWSPWCHNSTPGEWCRNTRGSIMAWDRGRDAWCMVRDGQSCFHATRNTQHATRHTQAAPCFHNPEALSFQVTCDVKSQTREELEARFKDWG